ncbi:hypothetical protein GCM10009828_018890 [Actinoplanes couchii]
MSVEPAGAGLERAGPAGAGLETGGLETVRVETGGLETVRVEAGGVGRDGPGTTGVVVTGPVTMWRGAMAQETSVCMVRRSSGVRGHDLVLIARDVGDAEMGIPQARRSATRRDASAFTVRPGGPPAARIGR